MTTNTLNPLQPIEINAPSTTFSNALGTTTLPRAETDGTLPLAQPPYVAPSTSQQPLTSTPAPTPTPSQWNVTGDQTVQGQVKNIIDANSPLMQQAETRALQQSNSRGLINSSMAVGAGQAALYDAAVPIAASDASMYGRAAETNNSAINQFKMAEKAQGFDLAKMDKSFDQNKLQLEQKFGYDTALTKMQSDSARQTAEIAATYKNLTQASASAASLMNNSSDQIHQIMMNENLDSAGKQAAIDTYNANLNKALMLIGSFAGDVDLSNMLGELLG